VIEAVGKKRPPELPELLAPFLQSSDGAVLRAALAAYRPDPASRRPWQAAVTAYEKIAAGRDVEAKVAALGWLEPWAAKPEVEAVLRGALADRSRNARIAALRILRAAGAAEVPPNPGAAEGPVTEIEAAMAAAARGTCTVATIETAKGEIEIELYRRDAPLTSANFIALAKRRFYDGLTFMRAVPAFVIQGGDPRNDQEGGPGYTIRCEINMQPFRRGSVGMALAGKDTGGSQFFITLAPQPHLDGGYTCFGRVLSGMSVAERIVAGDVIRRVRVVEEKVWFDRRPL